MHPTDTTASVKILHRALDILHFVFEKKGSATFADIQKELSIPKASLHRLLAELTEQKLLEKNGYEQYKLGLYFVYYGEQVKDQMNLISICTPFLEALAQKVGENANLNIAYKDFALTVLSKKGEESVLSSKLLPVSAKNCSSSGKIFLALSSEDALKKYFEEHRFEKRTSNSIDSFEQFLTEKSIILRRGYSSDNEEYEYGLSCLSVGLENHAGLLPAAISISGPFSRMRRKGETFLIQELRHTAGEINAILKTIKYEMGE